MSTIEVFCGAAAKVFLDLWTNALVSRVRDLFTARIQLRDGATQIASQLFSEIHVGHPDLGHPLGTGKGSEANSLKLLARPTGIEPVFPP
jgi:hypothetical protein